MLNFSRYRYKGFQVIAKNLHRYVAAHTGYQFVEAHFNRLDDFVFVTGDFGQFLLQLINEVRFRPVRVGPFGSGFNDREHIGDARRHRVGGNICSTDLGKYEIHFRQFLDFFLQRVLHCNGLGKTGAGNAQSMDGEVPFIQSREKLASHASGQKKAQDNKNSGKSNNRWPIIQRKVQYGFVNIANPFQQRIFFLRYTP